MGVLLYAVAVADAPDLDEQAVAYLRVPLALAITQGGATALDEPEVGDKTSAIALIAEVGPDDVVEYVSLEGVDGVREAGEFLGAGARGAGRVDDEAGDVVKVGVGDEVGLDERTGDVTSVGFRGAVREG